MVVKDRTYRLDDLLAMPDDGKIYEIIEGRLVVKSAPGQNHAAAVWALIALLMEAERAGYGQAYTSNYAVCLDFSGEQKNDFLPDLFFVRQERAEIVGYRCVEGAPDLVIEVLSPSTQHSDLGHPDADPDKFGIYERYGVLHYWIVDTETRAIAQFALVDGTYGEPVILQAGDTVTCPRFPGITMDVARVFQNMVERPQGSSPSRRPRALRSDRHRDPF